VTLTLLLAVQVTGKGPRRHHNSPQWKDDDKDFNETNKSVNYKPPIFLPGHQFDPLIMLKLNLSNIHGNATYYNDDDEDYDDEDDNDDEKENDYEHTSESQSVLLSTTENENNNDNQTSNAESRK
jgi:hypothetical protein